MQTMCSLDKEIGLDYYLDGFTEQINSYVNFQFFSYEVGNLFLCEPSKLSKLH
jgi:hypothetical protein